MVGLPCLGNGILSVVRVVLSLDGRTEIIKCSLVFLHEEVGPPTEEECLRIPLNSKYDYQRIEVLTWIRIASIAQYFEHIVQGYLFHLV